MKKRSKIFLYCYILCLTGFLFFSLNPKALKQIKHKIYDYLEIIENKYINITKSIPIKESQLMPRGYLTTQIINKKHYTLGYAESARQSEWAAYPLKREMVELALTLLKSKKIKRSPKFFEDKNIKGTFPKLEDYFKSGYDRGHIVSSADMSFSESAMKDTYFLSNMSPQKSEFNSGIWLKLEKLVREWAISKGYIYIISAGILTENKGFIGKNKILIPKNFYKIVLAINNNNFYDIISFIIPNEKAKDLDLKNYVVSVDSIEKKTKIDFFEKLDLKIKKNIKKIKNTHFWKFK
ncbi:DNA/RNA non-specific endonuclease [Borreliella lusitaniae]|uniref:DNA/RNA non-specific endonuclease n=1 Tax=Borreliella lusitaniae TaxID=100177 RepID=UPI00292DFEFB|nr:DNA/RNA non-specific endonuclease [Borreliella lusitaniae]WNY66769.1 DNA/RNA non-specific endonuclease [Borreliella lusitaniae]